MNNQQKERLRIKAFIYLELEEGYSGKIKDERLRQCLTYYIDLTT